MPFRISDLLYNFELNVSQSVRPISSRSVIKQAKLHLSQRDSKEEEHSLRTMIRLGYTYKSVFLFIVHERIGNSIATGVGCP
jgi:hypothetical protein